MTFTLQDALRVTEDVSLDGDFEAWLREVWNFYVEPARLNVWSTGYELIGIYRLIRGLCALYGGFYNVLNDCGEEDIDVRFDLADNDYKPILSGLGYPADCEEYLKEFVNNMVSEYGFNEVRHCLAKVGCDRIFASLYYASEFEDFSFDDDFDNILDSILNDVTADKMTAYEWLKETLG